MPQNLVTRVSQKKVGNDVQTRKRLPNPAKNALYFLLANKDAMLLKDQMMRV
jgi:hypothetical protein